MAKSSTETVSIPTILLKNTLLHLPGVTFNLSLTHDETFYLLDGFLHEPDLLSPKIKNALEILRSKINVSGEPVHEESKLKISKNGKNSINLINKLSGSLKHPIIACLQTNQDLTICSNVSVISKVVNVQILPDQCILGLRVEFKGYHFGNITLNQESKHHLAISKYAYLGEIWYEILPVSSYTTSKENLKTATDVISGIKENIFQVEEFLNFYGNLDNSSFKDLLFKLNPLAELLYIQLSDPTTNGNLLQLKKLLDNIGIYQPDELLKACDIYVSIFPFSFNQGIKYLQLREPNDQLIYMLELVQFVSVVFKDYLNMDYVLDSWNRLGKLQNGKYLQSKFIFNHFNGLKELLDLTSLSSKSTSSSSKSVKSKNKSRSSSSSNNSGGIFDPKDDDDDDDDLATITEFVSNIKDYDISEDGKNLIVKDYKRLKKMQSSSTEYQQLRNYFDIVMDLPWNKRRESNVNLEEAEEEDQQKDEQTTEFIQEDKLHKIDIGNAKDILNNEHYGMEAAKERILEHLAILKLTKNANNNNNSKSPILLLNGPPGVGKTSLAKSIASSLDSQFQRISLGGINDFADLKGHRRTYVGANPGLIIQALRRAKTMNPVILLDEIDKIGVANNKGNPEAALLEILDPEQNVNFTDHYVGFPVDLSKVIFIATSNDKWEISEPLRDRMETIDLDGYNYKEKVKIAEQYILPRQLKRNGLSEGQVIMDVEVFNHIANAYTHEAGIRNFERLIGKVCRKKAIEFLKSEKESDESFNPVVTTKDLIKYLGVPHSFGSEEKYSSGDSLIQESFGIVNGLSYNSDGSGSLLKFEMVGVPGGQRISCTGNLGSILLESCEIAETLVEQLIQTRLFLDYDSEELIKRLEGTSVHMHVPEGSIGKDGPSAGLTMTLCYLSLILEKPVPKDVAMTGEVTLTSKALPIGGLKEKLLGASLSGQINKVLAPRLNRKDLITAYVESIPDRDEANEILTRLVIEEEDCLSHAGKRYKFSTDVEDWIKEEYGLDIKYVDDFMGVINEVWNNELKIVRKEIKANL